MAHDIQAIAERPDLPSYLTVVYSAYFGLARDDAGRPLAYDMDSTLDDLGIVERGSRRDIKELWRAMAAEDSAIESERFEKQRKEREAGGAGALAFGPRRPRGVN